MGRADREGTFKEFAYEEKGKYNTVTKIATFRSKDKKSIYYQAMGQENNNDNWEFKVLCLKNSSDDVPSVETLPVTWEVLRPGIPRGTYIF